MKLVKLTLLDKFRSLNKIDGEDFVVNFREDEPNESWKEFHPYCFAGLNGSGKSNVLEALANIFYHLECCTLNSEYSEYLKSSEFQKSKGIPTSYELEYYIIPKDSDKRSENDFVNVIIRKEKNEAPKIKIKAQDQKEEGVSFQVLSESIRTFLPELVIGYSSGENEILSLPFIKSRLLQLDEYYYHLKNIGKIELKYDLDKKPESSLVYMDYHMSQAILLSNFLLQDNTTLEPIKNQLDIDRLDSFRLVINNHKLYHKDDDLDMGYLLPLVKDTVDKLRKCSTINYFEKKDNGDEYLEYLDFYVDNATKEAFRKHFVTPLRLFKAFQVLSLLNLRVIDKDLKKEIYKSDSLYAMYKIPTYKEQEHIFHFNLFKIKKNDSSDKMLLKAFSDGEHQFLHTMGICLMLQDKNTLFLLDEPETHFNPEWRSEFISLLKESLGMSGVNHLMRDIIITSHSPFIISDCYPDKVIIFDKGKQPQNAIDLNVETFGTSVNLLTNKIFKRKNTIGNYSLSKIAEFRKRSLNGEETNKLIEEINNELGDSIEKLILIKEISQIENIK
ncbi:restriction system-associated AAA family ATPase [Chryseobacterium bernardetii]|uniref:Restriction system-associated AAA family ATPase n=2 Tax=Chryseobacterium TaxID=59732 RepID=A0A543ELM2_9FLAO|nr:MULTISPECIES: restriction system-associated AAA family ATPase [Chryseobacterium]MDR6368851.1 restriction system-associated AAA family ATPase [Chryseobacterium vietnamense]MDR6440226.1 restriction system-associated AAA family ATPase [Chryseobacterium bernardetii]TQM22462.1 restriction system-associated AAA family ATPase [Chryseobacterium aquifrigidense]